MATYTELRAHPFVYAFAAEHDTIGKQKAHLRTVPMKKLITAFQLIDASDDHGALSTSVKGLLENELRCRHAEMTRQ